MHSTKWWQNKSVYTTHPPAQNYLVLQDRHYQLWVSWAGFTCTVQLCRVMSKYLSDPFLTWVHISWHVNTLLSTKNYPTVCITQVYSHTALLCWLLPSLQLVELHVIAYNCKWFPMADLEIVRVSNQIVSAQRVYLSPKSQNSPHFGERL